MALAEDVANAMHALEMLASRPEGRRVSEIAERLGINKAIAHRLLAALVSAGYVSQDVRTSSYFATHSLGALGLRQLSSSGVGTWAQRSLDSLAADSEELVRLAVATNDSLQWIAKAQGSNSSLRLDPVMGQDAVPTPRHRGRRGSPLSRPNEWMSAGGREPPRRHAAGHPLTGPLSSSN